MSLIILQPAASKSSQDHYKRTISNPVSIERIEPYVSQQLYETISRRESTCLGCNEWEK